MERYQYEGILPHARSASESSGADPARVVRIDVVRKMADLLNQAIVHRNSDTPEHAAGSLEACLPCLAELEAALVACRAAFREVEDACSAAGDSSFSAAREQAIVSYPVAVQLVTILNDHEPEGSDPVAKLKKLIERSESKGPEAPPDGTGNSPPGDEGMGGDETQPPADPDREPTEDQPTSDIPAEGEAGQEALTGDSQYGKPEDVFDLPDEDMPPAGGRKGRRR